MKQIRFARSSRRHRIGKAHVHHVVAGNVPTVRTSDQTGDPVLTWIATDDTGRELEIAVIETPGCFLVVHVMPTALRRKEQNP